VNYDPWAGLCDQESTAGYKLSRRNSAINGGTGEKRRSIHDVSFDTRSRQAHPRAATSLNLPSPPLSPTLKFQWSEPSIDKNASSGNPGLSALLQIVQKCLTVRPVIDNKADDRQNKRCDTCSNLLHVRRKHLLDPSWTSLVYAITSLPPDAVAI
jgi:hypothetical protein